MFNVDKNTLKQKMHKRIKDSYISLNSMGNMYFTESQKFELQNALNQTFKDQFIDIFDTLIDELYTHDDFEKDMGLR